MSNQEKKYLISCKPYQDGKVYVNLYTKEEVREKFIYSKHVNLKPLDILLISHEQDGTISSKKLTLEKLLKTIKKNNK